jgi:hypothetical protein
MARKRHVDERQCELSFETQVETYCEAAQSILEHAKTAQTAENHGPESEIELNVGLTTACKAAIQRSGMSREQVLDRANALFGRCGKAPDESKRPVSIHVFNNYLSKPTETRLPLWLLFATCAVTHDVGPLEHLIGKLGGVVITEDEQTELLLGKLDRNIRAGMKLKRDLINQMRRSGAAQPNTEGMEHGKEEQEGESGRHAAGSGSRRAKSGGNADSSA